MARFPTTIVVVSNRLPAIKSKFGREVEQIKQATALQLYASAAPRTPVDTGALKGNVTIGPDFVTWHQFYAGFVNYGTRYMPARPFIDEAVAEVAPMYLEAMAAMAGAL